MHHVIRARRRAAPARRPFATLAAALFVAWLLAACSDGTAPAAAPDPDAEYDLLFVARSRGFDELHVVPADGGTPQRLFEAEVNAHFPAASPDGTRIAYLDLRDDELWVADRARTTLRNVSRYPDDVEFHPAWSPDGRRLAFASGRDGALDVFVVDVDGGVPVNVMPDDSPAATMDQAPAWSPDGRRLAFASDRDGSGSQIWTMRPDGSDLRRLTTTAGARGYEPSWSPDGRRIVFRRVRDVNGTPVTELALVDADGTGLVELPMTGTERTPSWSPDGERIAFTSDRTNFEYRLFTVRPDGSDLQEVAGGPALGRHAAHPRWMRRR